MHFKTLKTMDYPKYLKIGNWLFKHLEPDWFYQKDRPVGGQIPENLYYAVNGQLNLSRDLRTYEGLIAYGCTIPSDEELLCLIK